MATNIFIGADGGGTKTKILIENQEGAVLGQALSGPGNVRTDCELAWHSIMTGIHEALKEAGLSLDDKAYAFHAGFGLAGCELPEAADEFMAKEHPFETLSMESDAITACLGAHAGEDGAIIIVGTGIHGCQIYKGNIAHVSGWGFPQGDEGGGAWIGLEAIRLTLRVSDGRAFSSPLCDAILEHFNGEFYDMLSWTSHAGPRDYAALAPLVIEYAGRGDAHAAMILDSAAVEIDMVAQALEDAIDGKYLTLCLFGGIAPHVKSRLNSDVKNRLVDRRYDATRGGIFLARQAVLDDDWQKGLSL